MSKTAMRFVGSMGRNLLVTNPAVTVATAVAVSPVTTLAQTIAIEMKAANSRRGKFTPLRSSFEF